MLPSVPSVHPASGLEFALSISHLISNPSRDSQVPSSFFLFYFLISIKFFSSFKQFSTKSLIYLSSLNLINITFLLFLHILSHIQGLKLITKKYDYLLFSTSYFSPANFRLFLALLKFVLIEFCLSLSDIRVKYLAVPILYPYLLVRVTTGCRRISFIIL